MMKNKKVFVSGGSGVIGKELINLLLNEEANVLVGDLKPCPEEFKNKIKYRQGDLNEITKEEIEEFSPEIYFHLAASFERSEETYEFWDENFKNNINLSHHLLTLIKDLESIKKIIFASSYLIYDPKLYQFKEPQDYPKSLKESDPIYPRNLTGVAKLSHEIDLRFINHFKNKKYQTISARIYRGYGCNSRDIISRWIRDLIHKKPINVYRAEGIFDYIYAADSAKGLLKLATTTNFSGVINLGTGKARKVNEILKILEKYFPEMKIIRNEAEIDFEASQADITLLKKELNWSPEYNLEKAIPLIIDFEKKDQKYKKKFKKSPTVLVTSAGKKMPLIDAIYNALKKYSDKGKVISGDSDKNCIAKLLSENFLELPKTIDQNLELIKSKLIKNNINIVIPTRDGELQFWADNKANFDKNGIKVIVSSPEVVNICLDKLKFYKFGFSKKFNFINSSEDINSIDTSKYVVKERFGAGAKLLGLNLSKEEAINHGKMLRNPIFQPYITGEEISIDAWLNNSHKVKGIILRRRDIVINGESKVSTTFQEPRIEDEAIKVLETLRLNGPVVLQAILHEGKLFIIECNARIGGASLTSIRSGLDSLYWSIIETQGENLDDYHFHKSKFEKRKIRIEKDIYLNL